MVKNGERIHSVGIACLLAVAVAAQSAGARETNDLNVQWGEGHTALQFVFRGDTLKYPQGITTGEFPAADGPPEVDIESGWPLTTYRVRWTVSTKDWPAEHRANALDFVLLRACDADEIGRASCRERVLFEV